MKKEIWKDVVGYEGYYQVSNLGNVRRILKDGSFRPVAVTANKKGYGRVHLCVNNKKKRLACHRMVAQAFIPNPENKPEINHIDGNPSNNILNNLEWCTRSENIKHSFHVLKRVNPMQGKTGSKSPHAKKVVRVSKNGNKKRYNSIVEAAKDVSKSSCNISACIGGYQKTCGGYYWFLE